MALEQFIASLSIIFLNKKKFIRYFFVGCVCGLVDLLLFIYLTLVLDVRWIISSAFSFCIATLINYFLSTKFVFIAKRKKNHQRLVGVYLVSFVGLFINQSLLYVLIEYAHINLIVSKILSTALTFLWNYYSRKKLVFRD